MGKISNYASALKAKLTDYFVIASNNNGVLETKKVTTEQIGDAVASDQVHSSLDTSDKTLIGGINEVNSNVGALSSLTTTDKSSLVGAVNEVDEFISHLSNKYVIGGTKTASGITRVDFGVTFSSPPVVSVIPLNSTSPQTYLRTCALVTLTSTYFEFVEIAIQNGSTTLINGTDNCVWIAAGNKA